MMLAAMHVFCRVVIVIAFVMVAVALAVTVDAPATRAVEEQSPPIRSARPGWRWQKPRRRGRSRRRYSAFGKEFAEALDCADDSLLRRIIARAKDLADFTSDLFSK